MLKNLHIQNYAIIEQLDIEFAPSLNTITGETGAGKSILLGALGLLGGARADISAISDGAPSCVVEGVFAIEGYGLERLFDELELDYSSEIVIRRVIQSSGKSRAFIDDMPVTLQTLRSVSDALIDIHSQHQTLLLARSDFQREIVDATAENSQLVNSYCTIFNELSALNKEIATLKAAQEKSATQSEFIAYQIEQLSEAKIREGEQEELEEEQRKLSHSEEIGMALGSVATILEGDQGGVVSELKSSINTLQRIEGNYNEASDIAERLKSCYIELKDIAEQLSDEAMNIESDPKRLEFIEQRLDTIYTLCRKHKVDNGDELIAVLAQFEAQYSAIEGGEELIENKEKEAKQREAEARELAKKLSESRKKCVSQIEKHIIESLSKLGIKQPKFRVEIVTTDELTTNGIDNIKFLFSANQSSAPQPIEGVASGGEMSRLMLSIKDLVAKKLKLPTIIFDEIDTGVSGAVADAMGEIIEGMSAGMQVINITHLPQVAAKGENHYQVYKDRGTHIKRLDQNQRIEQIAAMLSGATITDAAREQARTLLKK